jgi:hypothetical protein
MSKSKWPDARLQLDVTCLVVKTGHDGEDKLLSTEERNALIHKLIEKLGGVQAPGTGVVILPILKDDDFQVSLWVHDWE